MSETRGLIDAIDALWGGAFTTAVAAIAGRLMWHSTEVRSGRRRFFGRELLWELPIAIGMAIIGESVASYFGLDRKVSTGVVAAFAYLGPRGAEAVLTRIFSNTKG